MKRCLNEDGNRVHAKGRCRSCYVYRFRNGRDRPEDLIVKANLHRFEREVLRRRMATGT